MEPRCALETGLKELIEAKRRNLYAFPNYPLENIRILAAEFENQGIEVELDYDDYNLSLKSFFYNHRIGFPDEVAIRGEVEGLRQNLEHRTEDFSRHLQELKNLLEIDEEFKNSSWLSDLKRFARQICCLQDYAERDNFLINFGEEIVGAVVAYRTLVSRGPFPRYPVGKLVDRLYTLLCNLVFEIPDSFFPPPTNEHPNHYHLFRFQNTFHLRKDLVLTFAAASFFIEHSIFSDSGAAAHVFSDRVTISIF
mmetsp:Transcript_4022/g.8138  ORF Transcript_4022/g.8138 Transcript_4022/m.8138 type:complete len:252 (+) Transcript_4022:63-818(+)